MIRNLTFFFTFVITSYALGQVNIKSESNVIGHLTDGNTLEIEEFKLPCSTYSFYVDSLQNTITFQLREKLGDKYQARGYLLKYNMTTNSTMWMRRVCYDPKNFGQVRNIAIKRGPYSGANIINPFTGKNLWEIKGDVRFIDGHNNIALVYVSKGVFTANIFYNGIDPSTNSVLWECKAVSYHSWADYDYMNDSTIVIANEGLQSIDLKTGKGWTYSHPKVQHYNGYDFEDDFADNLICDSLYYYYESNLHLSKVRKDNGSAEWTKPLSKPNNSWSTLHQNDTLLYMFNLGKSNFFGVEKKKKHPFLAAYEKDSGQRLYENNLYSKDGGRMCDFMFRDSLFVLMRMSKLTAYNHYTGEEIHSKSFSYGGMGYLERILDGHTFMEINDTIKRLTELDSLNYYIKTDEDKILKLNQKFEIVSFKPKSSIYDFYYRRDSLTFLEQEDSISIVNYDGVKVAKIKKAVQLQIINGMLYGINRKSFYKLDLERLKHE